MSLFVGTSVQPSGMAIEYGPSANRPSAGFSSRFAGVGVVTTGWSGGMGRDGASAAAAEPEPQSVAGGKPCDGDFLHATSNATAKSVMRMTRSYQETRATSCN